MMRSHTSKHKVESFMKLLGQAAMGPGRIYLTGGATAVLFDWRAATLDIDFRPDPEPPGVFEALPKLKEDLDINLELAAPSDFVTALPVWRDSSLFIAKHGPIEFFHFDIYTQALSKIERYHKRDQEDVSRMFAEGYVDKGMLRELYLEIECDLTRYPAIDPVSLKERIFKLTESPE
jgi:hypothetical protein